MHVQLFSILIIYFFETSWIALTSSEPTSNIQISIADCHRRLEYRIGVLSRLAATTLLIEEVAAVVSHPVQQLIRRDSSANLRVHRCIVLLEGPCTYLRSISFSV